MMNYTLDTLKRYFKKTRWSIVLLGVLAFLTHGSILFYQGFGVDTDAIMNGIDNFKELGRPGLVWLGKFFGLDWFNLYYAQALAFLFIIFVPAAFGALFYIAGDQCDASGIRRFRDRISFLGGTDLFYQSERAGAVRLYFDCGESAGDGVREKKAGGVPMVVPFFGSGPDESDLFQLPGIGRDLCRGDCNDVFAGWTEE